MANRLEEIVSDELVAFLRSRLDEDEAVARAAFAGPWVRRDQVAGVHAADATPERPFGSAVADCRRVPGGFGYGTANADHIALHDPVRVLAEVEAKRELLTRYDEPETSGGLPESFNRLTRQVQRSVLSDAFRCLALPYAGHPDYRKEWRP
ncbi:DUF6221 family protein [Streptomyces platensis]|uniref:DUF6221 family protein n=1 Tax=Streptomyces platensis TaxID=58346 RepID=UPI003C30564B